MVELLLARELKTEQSEPRTQGQKPLATSQRLPVPAKILSRYSHTHPRSRPPDAWPRSIVVRPPVSSSANTRLPESSWAPGARPLRNGRKPWFPPCPAPPGRNPPRVGKRRETWAGSHRQS